MCKLCNLQAFSYCVQHIISKRAQQATEPNSVEQNDKLKMVAIKKPLWQLPTHSIDRPRCFNTHVHSEKSWQKKRSKIDFQTSKTIKRGDGIFVVLLADIHTPMPSMSEFANASILFSLEHVAKNLGMETITHGLWFWADPAVDLTPPPNCPPAPLFDLP